MTAMKGDDIADRLLEFAVRAIQLASNLPKGIVSTHVLRQLARAATGGGACYEEARSAESRADFAHKVLVSAKEVREAVFWVRFLARIAPGRSGPAAPVIVEGRQLIAILAASARTARARARGAAAAAAGEQPPRSIEHATPAGFAQANGDPAMCAN
jgi:four helix bundle protein